MDHTGAQRYEAGVRDVQAAVLSVIVGGEDYGYQIVRRLEDDWTQSAIYRALRRLNEKELIEPVSSADEAIDSRRKPYRATPAGHRLNAARAARLLAAREGSLAALLQSPPDTLDAVLTEAEELILGELSAEPAHPDDASALLYLERRLINEARLKWVAAVRERAGDATPLP